MVLRIVNAVCGKRKFVLDKGFYAYKHYTDGLLRYGVVPLIFPRKNFKLEKVLNSIQLTLDFFNDKTYRIKKKIHRFTLPSVTKITSLGVVLIGIAISLVFRDKGSLQRLAEW